MNNIFKVSLFAIVSIILSCSGSKKKANTENENQTVDNYSAKIDSLIETSNSRKFNWCNFNH